MSTLLKPLLIREELLNKGIRVFTPLEFSRIFQAPPHSIKYFLETQVGEGLLLRLKRGLYSLRTDPASEQEIANRLYMAENLRLGIDVLWDNKISIWYKSKKEIANRLYRPSYISFAYALSYYGIIPEMPYQITSATTKPTRMFTSNNKVFAYYTIQREAFTGFILKKEGNRVFLIAEPEKALVDFAYLAILGRGPSLDRVSINSLNRDKAIEYAKLYGRKKLTKMIKKLFTSPPEPEII